MTTLWAGQPRNCGSILGRNKWYFSYQNHEIKVHPFKYTYWSLDISFISISVCHLVLQCGVTDQRSTNSCLFCCQKGTIIVSASLKRRAYAPGENILISADIVNMSNTPIHRSCAKLIQVSLNTFNPQSTKKWSYLLLTCLKKSVTSLSFWQVRNFRDKHFTDQATACILFW